MTPGTRHKVIGTFDDITSSTPEKSLLAPLKNSGGRNNSGKMTVRYIGGGHKKMYRVIDFKRDKDTMAATVKTIEYDPNRSARIALLAYPDGEKRYMLAPNGLNVGQVVSTAPVRLPKWATRCSSRTFRWVRWYTTSNSTPARAPRWRAVPVPTHSFWLVKVNSLLSNFLRARLAWYSLPAALRSEPCRTPTTASNRTVRPAAAAGWAAVRATAV